MKVEGQRKNVLCDGEEKEDLEGDEAVFMSRVDHASTRLDRRR